MTAQLTRADPESSDDATLILDRTPRNAKVMPAYKFSGAGWNGDNTVTIRFPYAPGYTGEIRVVVDDGRFTGEWGIAMLPRGSRHEVTATGELSGKVVTESFTVR